MSDRYDLDEEEFSFNPLAVKPDDSFLNPGAQPHLDYSMLSTETRQDQQIEPSIF